MAALWKKWFTEKTLPGRFALGGVVTLWLVALAYGAYQLHEYASIPGTSPSPLQQWPVESRLQLAADRPTLVFFMHPKCPCSRATLAELERFLVGYGSACQIYGVFVRGQRHAPSWIEGPLWEKVGLMENVARMEDAGGVEGGRFQVGVSGECFLFAPDGSILFHGGITPARGHIGDSRGLQALMSRIKEWHAGAHPMERVDTPVFGCSIRRMCTPPAAEGAKL